MTAHRCDAIVMGAGVIGAAVALELARSGRHVVVVDKGPGAGTGTTSASSAIIRFSYAKAFGWNPIVFVPSRSKNEVYSFIFASDRAARVHFVYKLVDIDFVYSKRLGDWQDILRILIDISLKAFQSPCGHIIGIDLVNQIFTRIESHIDEHAPSLGKA